MSRGWYLAVSTDGIYEIVRVSATFKECVVVQTNIRTAKKAEEACKIWEQREMDVPVGKTETS
jgi:hypothetical protein